MLLVVLIAGHGHGGREGHRRQHKNEGKLHGRIRFLILID
jgi:hypothetical protein